MRALPALLLAAVALTPAAAHADRPSDVVCDATEVCLGWVCDPEAPEPAQCHTGAEDVCVGLDSSDAPIACAPAGDETHVNANDVQRLILGGDPIHH